MPEYLHSQDIAGWGPGRVPGCSISPFKPIVTNLPTWLRLGVFVVACGLLESCWSSGGTDVQPIFGTGL